MTLADFVKFYPLRASNISWLFGAGASISAGVPSAYDLIWDFKRRIYCAEQGLKLSIFENLSDSAIRNRIQSFFDSQTECPAFDSPEEYSYYFERAFPNPKDRSEYISRQVSGLQLTYGHKIIGTLVKNHLIHLIFTTNFDKAFENTLSKYLGTTDNWFSVSIDNAESGLNFFQSNKRPLIIKMHGDYLSEKLKNTSNELQSQDEKLRSILSISSPTSGIGIMGYSGRDSSVLYSLHSAIIQGNAFPHGIFWFIKSGTEPLPEVVNLINKAKSLGIEAEFIEIETFDSAWGEILNGFNTLPSEDTDALSQNDYRFSNRPLPETGKRFPLIRLNAIQIKVFPATARIYKCNAGNTKEIRNLILQHKGKIFAIRKSSGIVGFGPDEEFKKIFESYGSGQLDIYQIPGNALFYDDSSIKGLLSEAFIKAIVAQKPLISLKRRSKYIIIPNRKQLDLPVFSNIKNELSNTIQGKIPGTTLDWIISLEIHLQHRLSSVYAVLNPSIISARTENISERKLISPFINEFKARWYNKKYDQILNAWINIIFENNQELIIESFPDITDGINATFNISKLSPFTKLR